jgi:perosamine synthetase
VKEILHSKPWIVGDDLTAVAAALRSGFIGSGRRTLEFEHRFSRWVKAANPGLSVGSGSAALYLAIKALGCGSEDEIVVPTYVCRSVLEAVIAAGARPVLCDVGQDWVVHPDNVALLITRRTKALIVPHMYGIFADVSAFRSFGVPIIEDCAQAIGSRASPVISGDVAVFSFHPTKCLTTGEGGMVVSSDKKIAARIRALRDGGDSSFDRKVFSPMSDLSAALGLSQLSRYDRMLARRREIASEYFRALAGCLPDAAVNLKGLPSMFFRFPMTVPGGAERYRNVFLRKGIHVRRGVDTLLHRLQGLPDDQFPCAVELYRTTLSLPIYPAMSNQDLRRCVSSLKAILGRA